jgi:two-component system sensor histidine kinase KdpD
MHLGLRKSAWFDYGIAFVAIAAVSALNLWLQTWIGYEAIALVYLLAVVLLALFVRRGPIIFGTALTALAWNFLFAPPRYSFHIGSFYDKMMLAMYFVVALTVAQLTARLKAERLALQKREERSMALYLFTRELAEAGDQNDILQRVINQASSAVGAEITVLLLSKTTAARLQPFEKSTWKLNEVEEKLAIEACQQSKASREVADSTDFESVFFPLSAGSSATGVLAVRLKAGIPLTLDQRNLLENFARQTALVLDRQRLRDAEVSTRLLVESERFGRTLLNSVSHELRTPLSAIASATATLRHSGGLSPIQQRLSSEIDSATNRLNRVVQSLLSAARIQSGQLRPNLDWCDVSDVLRATLRELGPLLSNHKVQSRLDHGLPLIRGDFTLLQQAVTNLLVNAATHTPAGTQIEVTAHVDNAELIIEVADNGPGLTVDQLDRIFDLFYRPPGSRTGGTGLGLAIVKGFIESQGGSVQARNRPKGGAAFTIRIPVAEAPAIAEESA